MPTPAVTNSSEYNGEKGEQNKWSGEGSSYYQNSSYHKEVKTYMEDVMGLKEAKNLIEPLYFTNTNYYTESDFEGVPELIIHLAKNEIYARHGYIFNDIELHNYFMACLWYKPSRESSEFDALVFNEYEKANLKLLGKLDTYKQKKNNKEEDKVTKTSYETTDYDSETYENIFGEMSEEEVRQKKDETAPYRNKSKYHQYANKYWESVGVTDISPIMKPNYYTDMKYYTAEDFKDVPELIIHIAKNEIYARHGYIFKNKDLNEYFMGLLWYTPSCESSDFDASVFNEYEKANLALLNQLDK